VFRNIRAKFSISEESYLKSLTNGIEQTDLSSGKSGAKFYITDDHKYILKTIASEDIECMHSILTDYHKVLLFLLFTITNDTNNSYK
jgi:hypothetical protein